MSGKYAITGVEVLLNSRSIFQIFELEYSNLVCRKNPGQIVRITEGDKSS